MTGPAGVKLRGSFVVVITPFDGAGRVDLGGLREWVEFHAAHGTSALLIMGSTGEASMLTLEERQSIIRAATAWKRPGMPLYFGCSGGSTQATIDLVRYAGAHGADGAIITVPSYVCPSQGDAIDFYRAVADASSIPLGIYNNPERVKTDLSPEAVLLLARHPNIVILKEASSAVSHIAALAAGREREGVDLSLMCCDSPHLGLVIPLMALGGEGTANMTGNIAPQEMATISKPWESFDDALACRRQYLRLLPLLQFTYSAVNPVPVKSLAGAMGMPAGAPRLPLQPLPPDAIRSGVRLVQELGLADKYGYRVD